MRARSAERTIARAFEHIGIPMDRQKEALPTAGMRPWILSRFEDSIWVDRDGGAYCTRCGAHTTLYPGGAAHKSRVMCPSCRETVTFRLKQYSHKNLFQMFYAVEWMKSAIEPNTIVMIGYYCGFDQRDGDVERAFKDVEPVTIDVFRYGKQAVRFTRPVFTWTGRDPWDMWEARTTVIETGTGYFGKPVETYIDMNNFREAVDGTPFAGAVRAIYAAKKAIGRSWTKNGDYSELMSALARRPWIEYMAKAGFNRFALACAYRLPKDLINPKGKKLREILKLSPDRFAELKGSKTDFGTDELWLIQKADESGDHIKLGELMDDKIRYSMYYLRDMYRDYGRIDRALIRYLRRHEAMLLRDYWAMARSLGIAIDTQEARFPIDLRAAHDRLCEIQRERIRQAQIERAALEQRERAEKQELLNGMIRRYERLYCYEGDGLILRPARELTELIDEGNALHHCVGGYVGSYAGGKCVICFLRRADAPDVPWRTVEFAVTGEMVQDRGFRNDLAATPDDSPVIDDETKALLRRFWNGFNAAHPIETRNLRRSS